MKMILGIHSPFHSQVQSILSELPPDYNFVHVSEDTLVRALGMDQFFSMSPKVLLYLQRTYGNIVVSGGALWSDELVGAMHIRFLYCKEHPIAAEVPSNPYWEQQTSVATYLPPGDDVTRVMREIHDVALRDKRGVVHMSMEDVIKRAMLDLGIEPKLDLGDESKSPDITPIAPTATEAAEATEAADEADEETPPGSTEEGNSPEVFTPEPPPPSNTVITPEPVVSEMPTEVTPINKVPSVYLKMRDGTIALFLPATLQLPTQVIDGVEYQTLVFTAPNLGDLGLQELQIQNDVTPVKPPAAPAIISPISTLTVGETEVNLQQLVTQKVQLDQSIKDARAAGDSELVNELRRQRRHVRRQINAMGR